MTKNKHVRLGVNIDHVATVRNARGGTHPCPVEAAKLAALAGADGITAHLREDRRHIRDEDIRRLKAEVDLPLNLEMAATEEMLRIALKIKPHACCIVPEKRKELTTEGGLDVVKGKKRLALLIKKLKNAGIRVSLFVEAEEAQLKAAKEVGADIVELHTGTYCYAKGAKQKAALLRLKKAAAYTAELGLECHAGHGLTYETVGAIAALPEVREVNIGHFLIGEAVLDGLAETIRKMRHYMEEGG